MSRRLLSLYVPHLGKSCLWILGLSMSLARISIYKGRLKLSDWVTGVILSMQQSIEEPIKLCYTQTDLGRQYHHSNLAVFLVKRLLYYILT